MAKKINIWGGIKKVASSPAVLGLLKTASGFIPGVGGLVSTGISALEKSKSIQNLLKAGKSIADIKKLAPNIPVDMIQKVAVATKTGKPLASVMKDASVESAQYGTSKVLKQTGTAKQFSLFDDENSNLSFDFKKAVANQKRRNANYRAFSNKYMKGRFQLRDDLSKEAIKEEEVLKMERVKTKKLFDNTFARMKNLQSSIGNTIKKLDKAFAGRLAGLLTSAFNKYSTLYHLAYQKNIPLTQGISFGIGEFLNADAKISIGQAIELNRNVQKQLDELNNGDIKSIEYSMDNFLKKGTPSGKAEFIQVSATTGKPVSSTPSVTPVYDKNAGLKTTSTSANPFTSSKLLIPLLAVAGVGGLLIFMKKKKKAIA